jgi:hypothetical protein
MMSTSAKVIITGPGRSGTTFLVQVLTRLGFDTGYDAYHEHYNDDWRAGCEQRVELDLSSSTQEWRDALAEAPRILKSPEWALVLKGFVLSGAMDVEHVFIPVRDLDVAAASRLDAGLDWQVCETDDYEYKVMDQASVHALALGRALEACLVCDIPYTLMMFPRLVQDEQYCYDCLVEGLEVDREDFGVVFSDLARPQQVRWKSAFTE